MHPDTNETEKIVDVMVKSGIFSTMLATVRALLAENEPIKLIIKRWLAGIVAGMAAALACYFLNVSDRVTIIVLIIFAPFVSNVFPVLARWAVKVTTKKTEDVG